MPNLVQTVRQHYARDGIVENLFRALEEAGIETKRPTVTDLAPVDQMHLRGIDATRALAEQVGLNNGDRVLDVGCGLGGPARTFAAEYGCEVVGVDLVPQFVQAGNEINKRMGLGEHVRLREANALELPFEDGTFDVVTSMTAFMNIRDKSAAYKEMRRVLKPNGRLAQYEVLQGANGPVRFPVLWATDPSYSFLETADATRRHLAKAGFEERDWVRDDEAAIAWGHRLAERMKSEGLAPIGPHLLIGAETQVRVANSLRNLEEGRVTVAMIIAEATTGRTRKGQVEPVGKRH